MRILENIEPKEVFKYFEDICNIPHGSGNMEKISGYCSDFAKKHGLYCFRDKDNNVFIRKPASKGYENKPPVILQGHLDMVCEKTADSKINFETDPLKLKTKGDFIFADGTTLGGDDGIAVAMIMAILADKTLFHPEIEAVFTTDEETGMFGAIGFDANVLKGNTLINIDSEEMGVLTVSCAGGARADIKLPLSFEEINEDCYEITVGGLLGGHSGTEIGKGRLNANKIMGEFLNSLDFPFNIIALNGGSKDNAITREAKCILSSRFDITEKAREYKPKTEAEKDLFISAAQVENAKTAINAALSKKIAGLICALPFGVIKMSEDIKGLVQTSLNMGIIKTNESEIEISFAVRSSVLKERDELIEKLKEISLKYGAAFDAFGFYPAWEYNKNSRLQKIASEVYLDMFGERPKIEAIHAGLECGIFAEKINNFDAISIGPDLHDIHTTAERLSISSAQKLYDYICKIIASL